jgi:hypothetical protein
VARLPVELVGHEVQRCGDDVEQPVEVAAGGAPGCQLQGEREPVEPSRDLGEGLQVPVHPRLEVARPLGAAVSEP